MIAPHQTKKYFFSESKNTNASEASTAEVFLRDSRVTLTSVKNTQKTHKCPKKKQKTLIQPENFNELEKQLTGSVYRMVVLKNSRNFQENIRDSIFFLIFQTKTLHPRMFSLQFSQIFQSTSGRLLLKLSRKTVLAVFFSTEAAIRRICNKKL